MKRHYNFTDRTRINHNDIVIEYDPTVPSNFRVKAPHDLVTDPTRCFAGLVRPRGSSGPAGPFYNQGSGDGW